MRSGPSKTPGTTPSTQMAQSFVFSYANDTMDPYSPHNQRCFPKRNDRPESVAMSLGGRPLTAAERAHAPGAVPLPDGDGYGAWAQSNNVHGDPVGDPSAVADTAPQLPTGVVSPALHAAPGGNHAVVSPSG